MTINRSEGQTIERIGLYLREDVFTHGHLYLALSRARSWNNIRILSNKENTMKNVVFPGALLPVPPDPSLNEQPPPQPPDHQDGLPDDVDEEEVEQVRGGCGWSYLPMLNTIRRIKSNQVQLHHQTVAVSMSQAITPVTDPNLPISVTILQSFSTKP